MTTTLLKIKLLKLWEMLSRETDEAHPLTTNEIVKRLEEMGIRCDRRTVTMDIDMLNECGYEVMSRFVGHNKAYYVAERGFSTSELKILIDAVQAATFITDKKSDELIEKLAALGGNNRAELLTRNLVTFNTRKHTNEQVYYAVLNIETALLKKKKVSFFYYDLDENGEKQFRKDKARYVVDPIAMVMHEDNYPDLNNMFIAYKQILLRTNRMDYDDQMVFAHAILAKRPSVLASKRSKYHYICVDEAQDTSKIQHAIIRMLAYGQSLFMVGDEDQSIYGFRAAFPRAMLNFRYDYANPYILRMERNYRSTSQIVGLAQRFISKNKGRYTKEMSAERGDGEPVDLIRCSSRQEQYDNLLEAAKERDNDTAFLYRDNESSVVLIDLFLRSSIPFNLKKPEMNFFGMRNVKRIIDSLEKADRAADPVRAIDQAYAECYPGRDITRDSCMEVLKTLAASENNTKAFLTRLSVIEDVIKTGRVSNDANPITLSTIHSSKGLEYDKVYLVDVYDGRFPSSKTNPFSRSKDDPSGEQEERRLFYVGITRAKNKLSLFSIKNKRSSYIEELFPEITAERVAAEHDSWLQRCEEQRRHNEEKAMRAQEEQQNRLCKLEEKHTKEKQQNQKEKPIHGKKSVQKRPNAYIKWTDPEHPFPWEIWSQIWQQESPARDIQGKRWILCTKCQKIKPADCFDKRFYGVPHKQNKGICKRCEDKGQNI